MDLNHSLHSAVPLPRNHLDHVFHPTSSLSMLRKISVLASRDGRREYGGHDGADADGSQERVLPSVDGSPHVAQLLFRFVAAAYAGYPKRS